MNKNISTSTQIKKLYVKKQTAYQLYGQYLARPPKDLSGFFLPSWPLFSGG